MLPRRKRLSTELFNEVIEKGQVFHSAFFTLRAIKVKDTDTKKTVGVSVVAPKKSFTTAVERNKVRRRVYAALSFRPSEIIKKIETSEAGHFYCIVSAKKEINNLSKDEIVADLNILFVKSRIIK